MPVRLQTMSLTFEQIKNSPNTTPWVPLGNFMNQWFGEGKIHRCKLVEQPLPAYNQDDPFVLKWAAFCAASVLYLCEKYGVPCPSWASSEIYTLTEPWFFHEDHQTLVETTPEVFASRNLFCGDDVYANKYEFMETFHDYLQKRRSA